MNELSKENLDVHIVSGLSAKSDPLGSVISVVLPFMLMMQLDPMSFSRWLNGRTRTATLIASIAKVAVTNGAPRNMGVLVEHKYQGRVTVVTIDRAGSKNAVDGGK